MTYMQYIEIRLYTDTEHKQNMISVYFSYGS